MFIWKSFELWLFAFFPPNICIYINNIIIITVLALEQHRSKAWRRKEKWWSINHAFATCVDSICKSFLLDELLRLNTDSSLVNYPNILIPSTQHVISSHFSSIITVCLSSSIALFFFFYAPEKFFCLCSCFYITILYVQCFFLWHHMPKNQWREKKKKKKSTACIIRNHSCYCN
jgi:hypothetical protein